MAGWLKLAVRSFAVGGLFGAAQLGAAQALTLLNWSVVPTPELWRRELTWLLFIFAAAVLGGVAGGRRSVRAVRLAIANRRAIAAAQRHSGLTMHQPGLRAARRRAVSAAKDKTIDKARGFAAGAARVSATLFATLGASVSFVLVWLPARNAFAPADVRTLAVTAGIGVAVGAVISLLSLAASPIAANAGMTVIWIWVFGLTSVGMAIATGRPTVTPRLGVLDAPYLIGPDEWWLGPNLMIAVAAAVGLAVAVAARWIGAHRLGVALSGLAGPALLAAGYLLIGPDGESMPGYVAALLAATVGLLTSAATAAAHRSVEPDRPATPQPSGPAALTAGGTASQPQPLAIESGRPVAPARAQLESGYGTGEPVYRAPARSAPVPPARVAAPVPPRSTGPIFAAPSAPVAPVAPMSGPPGPSAPDPRAWPGGQPGPYTAPPVPAPARPTTNRRGIAPAVAPAAVAAAAPPAPASVRPQPAAKAPPPAAKPTAASAPPPAPAASPGDASAGAPPVPTAPATPSTSATAPIAVPSQPTAPAAGTRVTQPGAPATAVSAPTAQNAAPTPAAPPVADTTQKPAATAPPGKPAKTPRGKRGRSAAQISPLPVAPAEQAVPRTARPVEVVAVEPSTPSAVANVATNTSAAPEKQKLSRRAKRRAAREAERLAAEEAREERRNRRTPALDKREKEHVAWVQHLISLPNDPTLSTRDK